METEILPTDSPEVLRDAAARAASVLARGELVALPTETVYGLGADAFNPDAVAKIFEVKGRPSFDPLIVHVPTKKDLETVAEVPEALAKPIRALVETFWPGPLTLVLPKLDVVPDIVTAGKPTVAVRMSGNPVFRRVVHDLGRAIAAPSANLFGKVSPTSAAAVMEELGGKIPLVLDGGACYHGVESTIVAPALPEREGGKPILRLLRPGPVTPEELKKFGKVVRVEGGGDDPEAPGQLSSHYAPRTPFVLVDDPEEVVFEEGVKYALLSYRASKKEGMIDRHDYHEVAVMSPGSGKVNVAAVRLFFLMRQLDACGADVILAERVPERALGVAINDRLRRAAAGS